MRRLIPAALAALLLLTGCNYYGFRYQPDPQPAGGHLYADYTLLQDSIGVSLDTDGRRLEDIYIRKSDGTAVHPLNITFGDTGHSAAVGSGVGVGNGNVGFGTGIAFPIGPEHTYGPTTATFASSAIGPAPWELHIKVQGLPEAVFHELGGAPNAQ